MKGLNLNTVRKNITSSNFPYDYHVIENFLPEDTAEKVSSEFFEFDDDRWYCYDNPLENKRTIQDWSRFPKHTYSLFQYLCSQEFVEFVKEVTGIQNLYPDYGLHGGGWHMHGRGGNLNVHKDYSIHPKLNLQRKLNLIIYLTKDWDTTWGGGLELWSHNQDKNRPLKKEKVVECIYNRAVLFDTTQNSWHGLPNHLTCPENEYRKSLAIYYLTDPVGKVEERTRALYAPREEQEADGDILNLIQKRSM
jgi:Rps23 Pro-64 3,4-dihydroxylase Tpa1-like proline 4-hydroxylase